MQAARLSYVPRVPEVLTTTLHLVAQAERSTAASAADVEALAAHLPKLFGSPLVQFPRHSASAAAGGGGAGSGVVPAAGPLKVAIVFCGRQTPGAHNVVWGLYSALKRLGADNQVLGILDGTLGLFAKKFVPVTEELLALYKNQGGFDMLGRTADQISTPAQLAAACDACNELQLDGLVLVGGAFSNTDAAYLAEYLLEHQKGDVHTKVVGVPGSIDGDVANPFVQTTFGFDTACKVFSQLIGNMATDAASAAKYYYFTRVMGRESSQIALECALQTQPTLVLVGEEFSSARTSLKAVVSKIADVVVERAAAGKHFGLIVVPEGLIMHIVELVSLVEDMNTLVAAGVPQERVSEKLSPWNRALYEFLPPLIRKQLLTEREIRGKLQLSQVSTETLLADLVGQELAARKKEGKYKGTFQPLGFSLGYQARCSLPSNFDCSYAYTLGMVAASLVAGGFTGYAAAVSGLQEPVEKWHPYGVPLTAMMSITQSRAKGSRGLIPIIPTASVDIHGGAFKTYLKHAHAWAQGEEFLNPGPIQFSGPVADLVPRTVCFDRSDYLHRMGVVRRSLHVVSEACRPGASEDVVDASLSSLHALQDMLAILKHREDRK